MQTTHRIIAGLIIIGGTFAVGFFSGKGEKQVIEKVIEGKEKVVYRDRAVDKEKIVYKDGTVIERERTRDITVDKNKEITSRSKEEKPIISRYAATLSGSSKGDVSGQVEMRILGPVWLGTGMRLPDRAILGTVRLEL